MRQRPLTNPDESSSISRSRAQSRRPGASGAEGASRESKEEHSPAAEGAAAHHAPLGLGHRPQTAIDRISATALIRPNATALCAGPVELSFFDLMAEVNKLAAELCACGVGPDAPVGVCIPRSPDHVVAILACLRAGGAFLLLDPDWPIDRTIAALDDARAPVVIAPTRLAPKLASGNRRSIASAADTRQKVEMASSVDFVDIDPDSLAYVIYTSGSTGEPKGVEITHRNLFNLIDWHVGTFALGPGDRVSCLAGLSFDALVWELFPALACGATVHLVDESVRASSVDLRHWLVSEAITVAFVPTALAEPLIVTDWPAETRLRIMLTGGDTLQVWPKAGLPFVVVNNYGPTECTVVATSGIVPCRTAGLPTIGRPIANTQIHIFDEIGRPVGPGKIGEIYIAGANVGRGYRHHPSLTAQAFVVREGTERLYRTGDLGSWTVDGDVAFHGRRDEQLKVRGYRIEPNEISAALNRHHSVAQCAVVARGEGYERRLIAYLVPADGSLIYAGQLREFLARTLPAYMLPDTFVRLPALPMTPHGKLDRSSLPTPAEANTLANEPFREPSSEVELRIASLIGNVLGIERIGADDNFFLLGGHSLLGTQLILRIREAFGIELMLRDLFEAPTVERLAARVEGEIVRAISSMDEEEVGRRLVD